MENLQNTQVATPESVWALLQEVAQSQKETDRQIKELQKTVFGITNNQDVIEKSRIDFEEEMQKTRVEAERLRIENEKSRIDFDEEIKKSRAEAERLRIENEKSRADFDRRMKEIHKSIGGISDNQGKFAEEYFFNSFESGKTNFFGEKFEEITKQLKTRRQGLEDEYDIVLYNHVSVAIIEVKYKAHTKDIPAVLKKAETFRILYPEYKDFRIYLGLASMSFFPELEQECIEQGIAVIKQIGDKVVINDTNLKVF